MHWTVCVFFTTYIQNVCADGHYLGCTRWSIQDSKWNFILIICINDPIIRRQNDTQNSPDWSHFISDSGNWLKHLRCWNLNLEKISNCNYILRWLVVNLCIRQICVWANVYIVIFLHLHLRRRVSLYYSPTLLNMHSNLSELKSPPSPRIANSKCLDHQPKMPRKNLLFNPQILKRSYQ